MSNIDSENQVKDRVDPSLVPQVAIAGGDLMPMVGMGTFGSDNYGTERVSSAVASAIRIGYRLFDCAAVYGNEDRIGEVFTAAMSEGTVRRDELFVTSKVWNDMHGDGDVIRSAERSLKDLGLDYVDAYFIHWPFPNYHAPGCAPDARNPDSRPFSADEFMVAWRQMEDLKRRGLARHIGMSNMTITKLESVLGACEIKPTLIEMELHPTFQQPALFNYCKEKEILPLAFCPLGSPSRPERDRSPDDIADMELPEIVTAAKAHGVHPSAICLKWLVQKGSVPIPFSVKEPQIYSNLKCVTEDPLTDEEMSLISKADKDCRLVKGQVFLWEGASDWQELWD